MDRIRCGSAFSGAARIADDGIVDPARTLGHRIVAVAARDRARAVAFAEERGIERVHATYQDVVDDPDVDVVYNALVNSLHHPWNVAGLRAGKTVLSEKPMTSNAAQAHEVRDVARATGATIVEGFHYLHHPVNQRLRDLVTSGELGTIESVDIELAIPAPPSTDPRWSLDLAGGATMDLGCYVLSAARHFGRWIGAEPVLQAAEARVWSPEVDSAVRAELAYAGGGPVGRLVWDMDASSRSMVWTVHGTRATAASTSFAVPHLDPRLLVTEASGATREEIPEAETSYTHQLAALAASLDGGAPFLVDVDDAVANMELVDELYGRIGLAPRN